MLESGKMHYKGRLVLSATSAWIPKLLLEFYITPIGGHSGVFHTFRRIAQSIHGIVMKKIVTDFMVVVMCASRKNIWPVHLKGCCKPYQFQQLHGKRLLWILSLDYLNLIVLMPF